MKIGVVGCGHIAMTQHGFALQQCAIELPELELCCCCDVNPENALRFRERFGFDRSYEDMAKMIQVEMPKLIILLVPPKVAGAVALALLDLGVALFMEKPPGITPDETRTILRKAREKNLPFMAGYNRRYMPIIQETRKIIEELRGNGDLHALRFEMLRCDRDSFHLGNVMIHAIDAALFLSGGDPNHATISYSRFPGNITEVASVSLEIETEAGLSTRVEYVPKGGIHRERLTILARNESILIDLPDIRGGEGCLRHFRGGHLIRTLSGRHFSTDDRAFVTHGFYGEHRHFLSALLGNGPLDFRPESSVPTMVLMDAIERHQEQVTFVGGGAEGRYHEGNGEFARDGVGLIAR